MLRPLWLVIGLISLALGIAGVMLPLLPTTPFVLLSAFCFARSSPRWHDWLMRHPGFGPLIRNWQQHRAIAPRAKLVSVASMAGVFGMSFVVGAPGSVIIAQAVILPITALIIVTRPSGPKPPKA